jgi:Tol biopolymer transport system component
LSRGKATASRFRFVAPGFNQTQGQFSPDGRWIAYVSDESGRQEISRHPQTALVNRCWSLQVLDRDGRELFFWVGNRLTAALVTARGSTFSVDGITPLFEHRRRESQGSSYDVSADGQRFLVNSPVDESAPITLLINWPALLNKRE